VLSDPGLAVRPAPIDAVERPAIWLSEAVAGAIVRLVRRDLAEGEACLLAAMGLTEGCRMTVRSAGDPCIVEVRATRIGLARSVAERLLVRAEAAR